MARLSYTTGSTAELNAEFQAELEKRWSAPPLTFGHRIEGQELFEGPLLERENPAATDSVIARLHEAPDELVQRAIGRARAAQPSWAARPYQERIAILRAGAEELDRRLPEIAALASLETGKPRAESLAEVAESPDLIREYCKHMEQSEGYEIALGSMAPNEHNRSVLRPYGVFGVIAPFNFPSALLTNMTGAALLAGNTVVLKPSEKTTWSGLATVQALLDAGLPAEVLNVVLGGASTGQALIHSDVDGIAFTGSASVGREVIQTMAQGAYARPAITEMGSKNPAIVMPSADLEAAAHGIARAAFSASGQKCSACSRVLAHADIYDELVERVAAKTAEWTVGDARDEDAGLGPVVNAEAVERFERAVADAARDGGTIVAGGNRPRTDGHFVAPTAVAGLPTDHRLAREELFMPFITLHSVGSLDEALATANSVDYGLTAGIFSGQQEEIDTFVSTIESGIVYVNRRAGATIGAWPGAQTFCGWKASGSTGKGGLGPYFAPQFMREQSITVME